MVVDSENAQPVLPAEADFKTGSACWHSLPNTLFLGQAVVINPSSGQAPKQRQPQSGDGNDPNRPKGTLATGTYFAQPAVDRHDFPYTSCKKAIMQVTWWKDLYDHINTKDNTTSTFRYARFTTVVANSRYVTVADVSKGGAIDFKSIAAPSSP